MAELDVNPAAEDSLEAYEPAPVRRREHEEGSLTRLLEQQAAKIPSAYFLTAAFGSMALSVGLELTGRTRESRFVGMWAPTLLTMGVYNKLVKSLGPR